MTEDVRQKILSWIYDNHSHHDVVEHVLLEDGSEQEVFSDCDESSYPYVNSVELEKFIKNIS